MAKNLETMTNETSYIQRAGSNDRGQDVALPQRSTRLNAMARETTLSPRSTTTIAPTGTTVAMRSGPAPWPQAYGKQGTATLTVKEAAQAAHAARQPSQTHHELAQAAAPVA